MLGSKLGNYELIEHLGSGGFSTVYKAVDLRTSAVVAVKLLHPERLDDTDFVRRFRRESEIGRSLPDNPHIVRPIAFDVQDGVYYYVMEFVDGRDLSDLIGGSRSLEVDRVRSIGIQVADALRIAHAAGVVHRDIKPKNIRVTSTWLVKVLDFGIAKPSQGSRLTYSGVLIGTPSYIPPEVWEYKPADARSDIYALGIVLYEALTGDAPYRRDTTPATMRATLHDKPRSIRSIRSDVPPKLEAIVMKAMARSPDKRFQSGLELIDALRAEERTHTPSRPATPSTPTEWETARGPRVAERGGVAVGQLVGANVSVPLKPGTTTFGRGSNVDVRLPDRYLSHQHALIETRDGQCVLSDLKSGNGTWVNDRRIDQPLALVHGDQVRIGETGFRFVQTGRSATTPSGPVSSDTGRGWMVFSHASVVTAFSGLFVPGACAVIPLLIWLFVGRRNSAVGFQAFQATVLLALVSTLIYVIGSDYGLIVGLLATLYAWYGGGRCWATGKFSYVIIGGLLQRFRG